MMKQYKDYDINDNQKPLFLFQINPDLFYSSKNSYNSSCKQNLISNELIDKDDCSKESSKVVFKIHDFNSTYNWLHERRTENQALFNENYEEDESGATEDSISYYSTILTKSNDISTDELILTTTKYNLDNNYGFGKEYINVILYLIQIEY